MCCSQESLELLDFWYAVECALQDQEESPEALHEAA